MYDKLQLFWEAQRLHSKLYSFYASSDTSIVGVISGPVSTYNYYVYRIYNPAYRSEIRKLNSNGALIWSTDFQYQSAVKSMTIDSTESTLYLATFTTPVIVVAFKTSDGTIITSYSMYVVFAKLLQKIYIWIEIRLEL